MHTNDARLTTKLLQLLVIKGYRLRLRVHQALIVQYLDVPAKAYHLLAYLALETDDDADGENHDSQSHCNAPHGNTHCRARQTMAFIAMAKQSAGYG